MRTPQGNIGRLPDFFRRVAVCVAVLVAHLFFLVLFLQPPSAESDNASLRTSEAQAMQLRLLLLPRQQPSLMTSSSHYPVAAHPRAQTTPLPKSIAVPMGQHAPEAAASPSEPPAVSAEPAPIQNFARDSADSDGGFQDRLRAAQRASDVHGLPGSDKSFGPDMHFVDPMNQGVGHVLRNAQRLFGIKSRHCIDVEAWRSLTPQELSARHIAPGDVDRDDEKYACNAPPGLHF